MGHGTRMKSVSRRVIWPNFIIGGAGLIENGLSLKGPLFSFPIFFLFLYVIQTKRTLQNPSSLQAKKGQFWPFFEKSSKSQIFLSVRKMPDFGPFSKRGVLGHFSTLQVEGLRRRRPTMPRPKNGPNERFFKRLFRTCNSEITDRPASRSES